MSLLWSGNDLQIPMRPCDIIMVRVLCCEHTERQCQRQLQGRSGCIVTLENGGRDDFQVSVMQGYMLTEYRRVIDCTIRYKV